MRENQKAELDLVTAIIRVSNDSAKGGITAVRFEKFLLDNYIATKEGQAVYRFFHELPRLIQNGDKDGKVIQFIDSLLYLPTAADSYYLSGFDIDEDSEEFDDNQSNSFTFGDFENYVHDSINDVMQSYKLQFRDMQCEIPDMSLSFYYDFPEYSFPYLYPEHFNIMQEIFEEFQIYMPQIPGRTQHQARCYYYIELCRVLYEFRMKYGLTPEELCVFLYGFGRKFVTFRIGDSLPDPNKAWITGAGEGDSIDTLPNLTSDSIQIWMGRADMRTGDVVFVYERSPFKKIQHVMRMVSEFYDDPFHYYSGKIWLGQAQKIPAITFGELKNNAVMSQNGLVRAHMQGVGKGPNLQAKEYEAMLDVLRSKGFDITRLPQLMAHSLPTQLDINNEQDVEQQLLEPFLTQLGLTGKQITRQMPLRMGRGIRYYPDYVINAKTKRGEERGAFVWEAKYRIVNTAHMLDALYQAKSYALRLSSNGLGLASYEGIWLSLAQDKFSPERIQHFSWQDLTNVDTFARVSSLLIKTFG